MRIVSWNCNGGFSDKFAEIIKIPADLYLIQEVNTRINNNWLDNPKFPKNNYLYQINSSYEHTDKKGVLAFSFSNQKICELNNFDTLRMRYYQYFKFNGFRFLNVWTHKSYIEDLVSVTLLNQKELFKDDKAVIIGDFNSNVIWNKKHEFRSHTDFNHILNKYNYVSAYHLNTNESFGNELDYTFRLHGYAHKTYHIDYAYAHFNNILGYKINHDLDELSDHSPIEIKLKN